MVSHFVSEVSGQVSRCFRDVEYSQLGELGAVTDELCDAVYPEKSSFG